MYELNGDIEAKGVSSCHRPRKTAITLYGGACQAESHIRPQSFKLCPFVVSPSKILQSRLRLLGQGSADPLRRGAAFQHSGREQLAAHLTHLVLLLHGDQVLLLGEGQRPGHADEDGRGAENVDSLGREPGQALGGADA